MIVLHGAAFQQGLDSYYEEWSTQKVALVLGGLENEHGRAAVDAFNEGRKTAEEQDAL